MAIPNRKRRRPTAVTRRRIEAAIGTLGDLTTEEHPELDGQARDEIAHVIHVLDQISARKERSPSR